MTDRARGYAAAAAAGGIVLATASLGTPAPAWAVALPAAVLAGVLVWFLTRRPLQAGEGETARELEELRRRNEYLAALHETTVVLMERLDLPTLLHSILTRAAVLAGTPHGFMYLLEPGEEEMEIRVGIGRFSHFIGFRLARGEGLAGKVWERAEPMIVHDYDAWKGRSTRFDTDVFRAVIAVPLTSEDRVVGVIGVAHVEEGRRFGQHELALLSGFAELASLALENARLYEAALVELRRREAADHELRLSQQRLADAQAVADVGSWEWDILSDRFTWSDQMNRLFGLEPGSFRGGYRDYLALLPGAERSRIDDMVTRAYRSRDGFEVEHRIDRAGDERWLHGRCEVVLDGSDRVIGMRGTLQDVTERRRATETLESALRREQEAAARLRALDDMKNAFLAAVSHELRTPLASVLGFAVTLQETSDLLDPDETAEMVDRMVVNARKLQAMLDDLLDLDRLERGIIEPRRRPTDLQELADRVMKEADLGDRPVEVEVEPLNLSLDGAKVERIVENLLANAVRHTTGGTPIWLRIHSREDGVLIAVDDAGPGVPPEERDRIFKPFSRGSGAPRHSPGTGIGLSIVARFAELHGGSAWLEDREGGGSSFRVFLPAEPA